MASPLPPAEEALAQLELYQRQLEAVSRQLDYLQGALDDTVRARRTLEGLEEEPNREVLVPIGASTFVRGTLGKDDPVLSSLGAGYATERTRREAIAGLEEREKGLTEEINRMVQHAVQLQQEAANLQERLESSPTGAEHRAG